jgi:hypothetical protein
LQVQGSGLFRTSFSQFRDNLGQLEYYGFSKEGYHDDLAMVPHPRHHQEEHQILMLTLMMLRRARPRGISIIIKM